MFVSDPSIPPVIVFCVCAWVSGWVGFVLWCVVLVPRSLSPLSSRKRYTHTLILTNPPTHLHTLMHPCANTPTPTPTQLVHGALDGPPVAHACQLDRKPGSQLHPNTQYPTAHPYSYQFIPYTYDTYVHQHPYLHPHPRACTHGTRTPIPAPSPASIPV